MFLSLAIQNIPNSFISGLLAATQEFGITYIYTQTCEEWLVCKLNVRRGEQQNPDYPVTHFHSYLWQESPVAVRSRQRGVLWAQRGALHPLRVAQS